MPPPLMLPVAIAPDPEAALVEAAPASAEPPAMPPAEEVSMAEPVPDDMSAAPASAVSVDGVIGGGAALSPPPQAARAKETANGATNRSFWICMVSDAGVYPKPCGLETK